MPPLTLDLRLTRMRQCRGTHVAYSLAMLGGRIDRSAWAREVEALLIRFFPRPGNRDGVNKSAFAREVGVTTRTVERWLALQTDVKVETVRGVLEALRLDANESAEILQRIGFHMVAPPIPPDPREDPVIKVIMDDPRWTEEERAHLVQVQLDRIERDLERRREEYEHLIRMLPRNEAS